MRKRTLCSIAVTVALAVPLAGLVGCSGADDPQIPDAPTFTPPAEPEAPKKGSGPPPGYGASSKYQESMDRLDQ